MASSHFGEIHVKSDPFLAGEFHPDTASSNPQTLNPWVGCSSHPGRVAIFALENALLRRKSVRLIYFVRTVAHKDARKRPVFVKYPSTSRFVPVDVVDDNYSVNANAQDASNSLGAEPRRGDLVADLIFITG
jgi:hypothetical protein